MLQHFQNLESQVQKTTSTHFAKPKLEQKHNSLYVKSSKMPKCITIISQKQKDPLEKTPSASPR